MHYERVSAITWFSLWGVGVGGSCFPAIVSPASEEQCLLLLLGPDLNCRLWMRQVTSVLKAGTGQSDGGSGGDQAVMCFPSSLHPALSAQG